MPAYLINLRCAMPQCSKKATTELFGHGNDSRGKFCTPHGKASLKAIERASALVTALRLDASRISLPRDEGRL